MINIILNIDTSIFLFFNKTCSNKSFDIFYTAITNRYFWILPILFTLVLFISIEKRKSIFPILLSLIAVIIADSIAGNIFKPFFARMRPSDPQNLIDSANYLIGLKHSFSMPSNHAVNAFALLTVFSFFYPQKKIIFYYIAFNIAFSRIYVGVHYPSDVLVGSVFGYLIARLVVSLFNKIKR